ncbi:MAG TPA: nucleotidyltransferase domain-containing protein [Chitinophagaceae bacterium]|nr:nucleotidyltransferase domain-containing protein [Chitinophagaceae bacterium]
MKITGEHPPGTHILSSLAEKAALNFDDDQDKFISKLQLYQLEGRYPEMLPAGPDPIKAKEYFEHRKSIQMAQSEIIRLLQSYILLLNEAGLKIQKAFLYGSFARNEARADSDIDVMLVSENFDGNNIDEKLRPGNLPAKLTCALSLLP